MKTILNIKEKPYGLLLLTAAALLLALVFYPIANIDFEGKTMFNVPLTTMAWIIPLLLLSLWLLYVLTNRFLYSVTITRIHVAITALVTLLIVAVLYIGISPSQPANDRPELIGNAMQILSAIFVLGQFMYVGNVLLGLFGRRKSQ
jgi:hypothetical protein